jgi:hypothetical protein
MGFQHVPDPHAMGVRQPDIDFDVPSRIDHGGIRPRAHEIGKMSEAFGLDLFDNHGFLLSRWDLEGNDREVFLTDVPVGNPPRRRRRFHSSHAFNDPAINRLRLRSMRAPSNPHFSAYR